MQAAIHACARPVPPDTSVRCGLHAGRSTPTRWARARLTPQPAAGFARRPQHPRAGPVPDAQPGRAGARQRCWRGHPAEPPRRKRRRLARDRGGGSLGCIAPHFMSSISLLSAAKRLFGVGLAAHAQPRASACQSIKVRAECLHAVSLCLATRGAGCIRSSLHAGVAGVGWIICMPSVMTL